MTRDPIRRLTAPEWRWWRRRTVKRLLRAAFRLSGKKAERLSRLVH